MIRTKVNKKADSIFCADIHLREDTPVCRKDDYKKAQWFKMDFISDLQKQNDCPVICSGDLYDFWKPSPELLSETIEHLPNQFYTIYGNHDLPQHNINLAYKSGIHTLETGNHLKVISPLTENPYMKLEGCHWNTEPLGITKDYIHQKTVLIWHTFVYQNKEHWMAEAGAWSAGKILRKYPQYDLIVTGDHHRPFVEEYEGRLLVNPGSMMRMNADQMNFKPRVYLWYADTNTVVPVYLPIELNVISREHLKIEEQRSNRIDAFVSQLDGDWAAGISFEENLKQFYHKNEIDKKVINLISKSIEECI